MSRGRKCDRLRWTYPEVPLPRGVVRPSLEDIIDCWEAVGQGRSFEPRVKTQGKVE